MEAHLSQYHQIDIRDRGIIDEYGRRKLTLAMIAARTQYLDEDSPIRIAENGGIRPFTRLERIIGGDLFLALRGAQNPRFEIRERLEPQPPVNSSRDDLRAKRSQEAAQRRAEKEARLAQQIN